MELSAHGSPVLVDRVVSLAVRAGARLAEPGEFTFRAFLNGRLDLVQAEAVADLIDAVTPLQARAAFDQLEGTMTTVVGQLEGRLFDLVARMEASLDFPEEGYHFLEEDAAAAEIGEIERAVSEMVRGSRQGRLVREGCQVVILGTPNVGKSSIFNGLLGSHRAIVAPAAGTTRDLVTDVVDLEGLAVTLVDSAGLRRPADVVEAEGVSRARGATRVAAAVLVVVDRSRALSAEDLAVLEETVPVPRVVVVNKVDAPASWKPGELLVEGMVIEVSAATGAGLERLRAALREVLLGGEVLRDTPAVANLRHIGLMERARSALGAAREAAAAGAAEEFVLADLGRARSAFEELTGRRTSEDVLRHIFERFCIGK